MDCEYYDNDDVMAELGRVLVDQYIGLLNQDRHAFDDCIGAPSYIINTISGYVSDVDDEEAGR